MADAGLRLLLSDALSLRLGERSQSKDGRGGGRLHARAARGAQCVWRTRGAARRLDRRLRARGGDEAARSAVARLDRQRAKPARLSVLRRFRPHGVAFGLYRIALLAVATGGRGRWNVADLPRA